MTLKAKPLAALVVAIMFGGILFSGAMGWWQTESTKEAAVFTSGEFAGQADPADIRGSYTFGDVEKNFAIPASLLAEAFGVQTSAPSEYQVKELEELYAASEQEVGTASVRLFTAFYLDLPFDLSTDIYLPASAAAILAERDLDAERSAYLQAHTVTNLTGESATPLPDQAEQVQSTPQLEVGADLPQATPQVTPQASGTHVPSTEQLVKGKTTFAELLAWGVGQAAIESVLGMPMPAATGIKVKDFCTENGLSFETVKAALQVEVDSVK